MASTSASALHSYVDLTRDVCTISNRRTIRQTPFTPITPALPTASSASDDPNFLQNIQFYINSATGLPEPTNAAKRVVRVSCSSKKHKYSTDISTNFTWSDNTAPIGPVVGTDKIKFTVELHPSVIIKPFMKKTLASSASYTVNTLLNLQAQEGAESTSSLPSCATYHSLTTAPDISIPLTPRVGEHGKAFLLLTVKQPTAPFISKRLQEEAERLAAGKGEREGSSMESERGSTSSASTNSFSASEEENSEQVAKKGKQPELQVPSVKLPPSRGTSTN
ncbi:hypothetical protein DXG01_010789 [Tephrocybe rancida]|nr:hypothetical protein DXG01_010789 [Tephrocybe rancida]